MFAYGSLAVVLVLYLAAVGLSDPQIGLVLSLTLAGDTVISLWLTTNADRLGRRRVLTAGAILMIGAGIVFAITREPILLLVAATIGVISRPATRWARSSRSSRPPSASRSRRRAGPTSSPGTTSSDRWPRRSGRSLLVSWRRVSRRPVSGRSTVTGRSSSAMRRSVFCSSLASDASVPRSRSRGPTRPRPKWAVWPACPRSGRVSACADRAASFSGCRHCSVLDAFGGGLVTQSLMAYWFHLRWGRRAGAPRIDLLRGEHPGRDLGPVGVPAGGPVRAHQHDGLHPPAEQRPAHPRAADAEPAARDPRPPRPVQHQPDGRADPPELHDLGGGPG